MFEIQDFPFVLFFKEGKIYKYKGDLNQDELLKYLSGDNYLDKDKSDVYHENLIDFVSYMEGTSSLKSFMIKIGTQFTSWCEKNSKIVFKKIGLSHWNENPRMVVFTLIILGIPTLVVTYFILYIAMWIAFNVGSDS